MNTQAENGSLSTASPQTGDAAAFVRQGFELAGQQRLGEAVASFDRAVALEPDFAEAWIGRGIMLFYLGRLEEAVASYDRVLALKPDAEAFNSRGLALYTLDRLEEAVASYDRAIALKPDAQAFNIRGLALHKLGRFEEAVASYDEALALKPDYAEVFNSRGAALAKLGRYDEALESIDRAIALHAGSAELCLIVGVELQGHDRFDDALACYDRALALNPDYADAHFHRALAFLGAGDFTRGFEDYRWRFRIEDERRRPSRPEGITSPDWEGEPLVGKRLVIFVEQGYGDALQFVRYVPMAVARGAQVTLFAPAALLALLRASLPGVEVTDTLSNTTVFDYQAPMLDLPRIFSTTLDAVPAQIPYLLANPTTAASWAQRLAVLPGLKVGLVWAGSSRLPDIDARRSLKLAQFAPLAAVPGIRFVSLQIGEPAEEAKTSPAGLQLIDWTGEIRDYADTAALITNLDLVITVDTSVAHLTGALGKPVWILSRHDGCWRWLQGRQDSPWYPTARLFHQPTPGDWESVMIDVATVLQDFSAIHANSDESTTAAEPPSIEINPQRVDSATELVKQGIRLAQQRRFDEALANFDQAIALKPDFVEALIVRGIVLFDLRRFEDALASYDRALAITPDAEAYNCRGAALYSLGRFEEAVTSYDSALAIKPDIEAFNTRGLALYKLGRFDEAVVSYDSVLAINPHHAAAWNSRGAALHSLGRLDEEIASYDRGLALEPNAEIFGMRGMALYTLGRLHEAVASYDSALALNPNDAQMHCNRAEVLLHTGDLVRGFNDLRWRLRRSWEVRPTFNCPNWEDQPLSGKRLIINTEYGYGDILQFIRYVPMVAALGAKVTVLTPAPLIRLLRESLPGVEVIDTLPQSSVFDYQAQMLCLPRIFGTTLESIPAQIPYLTADQAAAENWALRLATTRGIKVGLVWAGRGDIQIDARRSLKLAQFAPLAAISGVRFISLQIGEPAEQAKMPPAGLQLTDWTSEIRDYADTAALIAGLDLVITVDTSVAHLAGGLGKPVWILSRYDGCWRWLTGREDSPWYPTARLFHQPAPGDWDPVVAQVATALKALAAQDAGPSAAADPQSINDAVALVRQGLQLAEQQHFDEALANFDKAGALAPDFAEAWICRGIVLAHLERFDDAVASYDRVLALRPDAETFRNRGAALYRLGRFEEAAASYDHALALQPDADTFNSRGAALYRLGRFDEALASYDEALALKPDYAEVLNSRGAALVKLGRLDEARESADRAIALGSGSAEICQGIGLGFHHLGRLDDALDCYDRALALEPDRTDTRYNRAVTLLRAGDLARGFEDYRWRFRIPGARPARPDWLSCPDWEGEPIAGKRLVIFVEQGYGDTLQFVRYVPMAQALGAQVTLFVPPELTRLLRASLPGIEVVDRLPETAVFDFQAPMLCLPRIFGTTLDTIPAATPYLLADPAAAASWARRLQALPDLTRPGLTRPGLTRPGLKVGLVWAGGREQAYDARRSLKLAQFAPLAEVPGVQFVSLQLGEPAQEAKTPPAGLPLVDWTSEIHDYADTAALVANLDLVITVDTSAAHLAGALNKPVWILSRYDGCWRWLLNRSDSPWYPSARLFHQSATQQWEPVIAEVAAALQAFSASRAAAQAAPAAGDLPAAVPPRSDDDALAFVRYGLQLNYRQRFDEAVANFDKAVALDPGFIEAWISRGIALFALRRFGEAVTSYDRALALAPDAEIFSIRGLALYMLGRLDEAIASYDRALALRPDYAEAQLNRAQALLRAGDLARGFEAYRWRFQVDDRPARPDWLTCPEWQGEPVSGKRLVIFHEQGFGDSLQFVRYLPMVVARGAHVTLFVPPALARLLRASLPGVEVVDSLPRNSVFDFQAPLLGLPHIFGTTLNTIPAEIPYLRVDQEAAADWARRLAALRPGLTRPDLTRPDLKVGLVWAGGKDRAYDEYRSLRLAQFAPFAAVQGVQFINLQLGESAEEAKTPPAGLELIDWTSEIRDYADTAALIAGLDLVITVCTSVAHLAGALGKPVWILLHEGCCWRWLMNRQDSPWYPSARLFRQPAVGQWGPVIADVAAALQAHASNPAVPGPAADDAAALVNCGVQLAYEQRFDEALASFDNAIDLKPDLVEAHLNRAIALFYLGRFDEAASSCDSALALRPDWAEALNHRAAALAKLGRFDQALDCYDRALALKPDWAEALNSRSVILDTLGRCDEALIGYDRVLALEPDRAQAQWNRTRVLLRSGDLARGFEAYRLCLRRHGEPPALACPEWQGEPIAGKRLVIFSEHGYGDTLQFVRYAPMAAALGARVTLLVRPALTKLLRASLPGIEVVDSLPGNTVSDFQIAMLCLPSLLHTTLDAVPAPVPYLHADPAAAASWARRLAALPGLARRECKVGLVWAGNKDRSNDAHRSLKLAQFAALAGVPGVQFVSLQLGEPAEEAKTPPAGLQLTDWTSELGDYADTAALVAGLDLVISVCTSVAHLAGALGKPVWIPLHYDSCWRWLLNREDSPWYPTARLFRQPAMGAWDPAMANLAAALRTFASRNALE